MCREPHSNNSCLLCLCGTQFKSDTSATYDFRLGDPDTLPKAAALAVKGMREGGRRRVLVPPQGGWVSDRTGPLPPNFGGKRRLAAHREEPLLFEAKLVRVRPSAADTQQRTQVNLHWTLPAPSAAELCAVASRLTPHQGTDLKCGLTAAEVFTGIR